MSHGLDGITLTRLRWFVAGLLAMCAINACLAERAHATDWYAVEPGECLVDAGPIKLPPEYAWTPATGPPDYYEVFACDWTDYCAWVADVTEPEWKPGLVRWVGAIHLAKHPTPRVRVRAARGKERGPYSAVCPEGLGIRGVR